MTNWWDYVSELRPPSGQLFIPQMVQGIENHGVMILAEETEELGQKRIPVLLSPP
jgi:hypothetical protein